MALPKASDNPFPSLLVVEGTAPSSPASGDQRLYIDSADHKLKRKDSGGTVTTIEGGGGGGSVATDAIWDAKGDFAVGTGADTAAKLAVGANGMVPVAASGETTGMKFDFPPGYEFDYVSRATDLTLTATSAGAAAAWIDGNAVTYDGSTVVKIEAFVADCGLGGSNAAAILELYDGSTDLGRLAQFGNSTASSIDVSLYGAVFLTPTAGAHTYHVKAWKVGTATLGSAAAFLGSWYRITKA